MWRSRLQSKTVHFFILIIGLFLMPLSQAATLDIAADGSGQFDTIGAALLAASEGDSLLVGPGTYREDVDFGGKNVEVRSTHGSGETHLIGEVTALTFVRGEGREARFEGFTLAGQPLRGILIRDASPTIKDCVVQEMGAVGFHGTGAFIMGTQAQPLLDTLQFEGLLANRGGIYVSGGAEPTFKNSEFSGNQATLGGAIYADASASITIIDSAFIQNRSSQGGGAIYLSSANLVLDGVLLQGNAITATGADFGGGHIFVEGASRLSLTDTLMTGEGGPPTSAPKGGGIFLSEGGNLIAEGGRIFALSASGEGGAIFLQGASALLSDVVFEGNNTRSGKGGAIAGDSGLLRLEGGAFVYNNAETHGGAIAGEGMETLVQGTLFCGNQAVRGGGISLVEGRFQAANAIIRENGADIHGGGLALVGSELDVVNSTISGNFASAGGGFYLAEGVEVHQLSNLLVSEQQLGEAAYAEDASSAEAFAQGLVFSEIFQESGRLFGGELEEVPELPGNIIAAPIYWSYAPGAECEGVDLFLHPSSPGVDLGDPSILDPDGTRSDMGAYGGPESADRDVDEDGFTWAAGDCDDDNAAAFPGADELANIGFDDDCDGLVDEGTVYSDDDADGYAEVDGDCDDFNPNIHPGAQESADGIDEDCDDAVDEDTGTVDDDGDGYSEEEGDCDDLNTDISPVAVELENGLDDDCDAVIDENTGSFDDDGDGYSENDGDCDDTNPQIYPEAQEFVDAVDQDCDGEVDEGVLPLDVDGDGFTAADGDCNEGDAGVFPNAEETPDGKDDDCDGLIDEGTQAYDDDGDGYSEMGGDCDDNNADIYPTTQEIPNEVDDDCDATIDEGTNLGDDDGDGFSEEEGDCDDSNPSIHPEADDEPYDGVDSNCDGKDPNDLDEDGYPGGEEGSDCDDGDPTVNPEATEVEGGEDEDCDGVVDEGFADTIPECDGDDDCGEETPSPSGSVVAEPDVEFNGGCTCRSGGPQSSADLGAGLLILMGLVALRRRGKSMRDRA